MVVASGCSAASLGSRWVRLVVLSSWLNIGCCLAACTCPDSPTTCTTDNLFSDTGEDDCVPTGGLLEASLVVSATTALTAVDLGGIVRISGSVLVSCTE